MPMPLEQFDWRAPRTWRALCALAVLTGAFIAVAALASEFLIRDVLGMPLGQNARFGPDIAVGALMLLLILKGLWRRMRELGLPAIGKQFRRTLPAGGAPSAPNLAIAGIFTAWLAVTMASYFVGFYATIIAFDLDGPGRFTSLVAVLAPVMLGQLVLVSELARLGARRKPDLPQAV